VSLACPAWTTLEEQTLARDWAHARLGALGIVPRAERQLVKHGSISVVWRQATDGGDVFFKAVPELFAPEPPLTEWLARRWPAHVPPVLAIERHRRWMLTRAVDGVALAEVDAPEAWIATARALARIQIDSAGHLGEIAERGCSTRSLAALAGELDAVLKQAVPCCAGTKHAVPDDLVRGIEARRDALGEEAGRLAGYGLPLTLIHGDLFAGNVIVPAGGGAPVILDWTDGACAHPFFDLLIFLRGRDAKRVAAHHGALVDAYLSEWSAAGACSTRALREAFELAQRLAPVYHAASYGKIFTLGPAAVTELGSMLPWLLAMLTELV
jgi:hypothetical protein